LRLPSPSPQAAPTPLYHEYQEHFGLTAFMIAIIFAAYVLCLLLALLTVGSLSDYIGRRPPILAALTLNVLAMILFMTAGSASSLIVARAMQGFVHDFGRDNPRYRQGPCAHP
jgi:MFS family permease